jgi:mono/diheme cytochrome c family protein
MICEHDPMKISGLIGGLLAMLTFAGLADAASVEEEKGDPTRGAYVMRLGGCVACHTDAKNKGVPLTGGLALKSPFGTFYTPNITPDPETGIGGWSTADFVTAMTQGLSPKGEHYYPSFPYTSYTRMSRRDLVDLKAYLDSLKPVRKAVPPHDMAFPFNIRLLMFGWKLLFFDPGEFKPDATKSAIWNRGAYIVNGPSHCGECHTARNYFGATSDTYALAGTRSGPEGKPVPNITSHIRQGIGKWGESDLLELLESGGLPDGDVIGGAMAEVVEEGSGHWTAEDRKAVAEYLLSLPARATP